MRKILCSTVVLLALFVSSCKKENVSRRAAPSMPDETIAVKLGVNQAYSLDLSNAGSVTMVKQASHYLVSETILNNVKGGSVYNYTPAKDFKGTDEVIFLSTKTAVNTNSITVGGCYGGDGYDNSVSTVSRHIILKIDVGN